MMSIRPEFARAILAGTKRVEFRKRRLADNVTHVVVYATAPVSAVIGAFRVAGQDTRAPHALWNEFADVAGIDRPRYLEYFDGRDLATGILVGDVLVSPEPVRLEAAGLRRPPQSFQYLDPETALGLVGSMSPVEVLAQIA